MRPNEEAILIACIEAVGRAGARDCEIGYLYDDEDPPPGWPEGVSVTNEAAGWYVTAHWRTGDRMVGEGDSPAEAALDLTYKTLHGGMCIACHGMINLKPDEGHWHARNCLWRIEGQHWLRGCDGGHGPVQNRALRRRRR